MCYKPWQYKSETGFVLPTLELYYISGFSLAIEGCQHAYFVNLRQAVFGYLGISDKSTFLLQHIDDC